MPYRLHAIISCYHEAGHAVMAWHQGIRILRVTMTPPDENAHVGLTETAEDETIGPAQAAARMQVAAAGEIAENWRLQYWKPDPEEQSDASLLRRFEHDESVVAESNFPRYDDRLIFAWWGHQRDELTDDIANSDASGPASWLPVFREAELLIRGDLWPAVQAVADELSWSAQDLSHEDIERIANHCADSVEQ
jgi:hypothetical protein